MKMHYIVGFVWLAVGASISETIHAFKHTEIKDVPVCNSTKCKQLEDTFDHLRNESCTDFVPRFVPAIPQKSADAFMTAYRNFTGAAGDDETPVYHAAAAVLSQPKVAAFLALPDSFSSGGLDFHMVRCVVLDLATPAGLAVFASQGQTEENLVNQLLQDGQIMRDMLVAGGPTGGKFGEAMSIWNKLQHASDLLSNLPLKSLANNPWDDRSPKTILHRLALGTALEYAVPVMHMNIDVYIDPVARYLHYEKAYLAGDLDPAFQVLTTFECRLVVNSPALNDELAWMRETLSHTRPDHIGGFAGTSEMWRYATTPRTDVKYDHLHDLVIVIVMAPRIDSQI